MSKLFDRYLKITTTGQFNVSLEDLHCKIVVSGAETGAPNRCDINIYNISQQTVSSIKAGNIITIDAGYKDLHGVIFEGEIQFTRYGKVNGVDTYLNLQCNNFSINNKIIAQTLSKNESIANLVKTVSDKVGLVGIEGLNYLPRDQYIRSKPIFGTAQDVLNVVSKSNGLYFMFNGEKYSIFDINNLRVAKTTILNKDTGLISRPKITQQGVEGRCLINPNIKVGSMVKIMQSSIDEFKADLSYSGLGKATAAMPYDPKGLYWIIKTVFSLDNRGKEWYIDFQAVNSKSVKAPLGNKQISLGAN